MLYAPAVCDHCRAIFRSGVVIAEHPGDPSSYRKAAGPCPRCGGRGSVPEWVFRFHATVTIVRERATSGQISAMASALRHTLISPHPAEPRISADPDLPAQPGDPWRIVAVELHRSPADQRNALLTLLLWMLDPPPSPPFASKGGDGQQQPVPGTRLDQAHVQGVASSREGNDDHV